MGLTSQAHGQLTYDADTGNTNAQDGIGAGWNTATSNWWNGASNVAWPNTGDSTSVAIFGAGSGAAGTVAVGTVTANGITFNAPGSGSYILSGGTITLAGTAPTITANVGAQIDSVLAGTNGLVKAGNGTLTLNGINTYSGTTYINAGSVIARLGITATTTENALSGSPVRIATGASLTFRNVNTNSALAPAPANALSGSGELVIEFASGTGARNTTPVGGFLTSFTGTIRLSTAGATGDKLNATSGINTAASLTVVQGTQLFINGASSTFNGGITVSGTGNSENRGAFRVSSGLTSHVTLAGNTTIAFEGSGILNGTIANSAASILTLAGSGNGGGTINSSIQNGTGTTSLTQGTTGTIILAGTANNNYTGATTVNAGTLRLNKTAGLHAIYGDGVAGTADLILGDGTGTDTLQLAASNQIRDSVEITLGSAGTPVFTMA
ncbi:MAG: beta strand repeat-containing protein, partial [Verrucomicrobium sp.]